MPNYLAIDDMDSDSVVDFPRIETSNSVLGINGSYRTSIPFPRMIVNNLIQYHVRYMIPVIWCSIKIKSTIFKIEVKMNSIMSIAIKR